MLIKLKYFFNLFIMLIVIYFFISTPHLDTNLTIINTYLIIGFIGCYAVNNFINASILKEVHKKAEGVLNDTKE